MTLRKSGPPNLGVLMIDFNPVVREGLLAILTKDDNIEVIGDVPDESAHLTEREVDVLRLMGNGDSNKTISATLGISLDTTKKHVRNVIDKLQARSRTHAAIIAAQSGIIGKPVNGLAGLAQDKSEPGSVA